MLYARMTVAYEGEGEIVTALESAIGQPHSRDWFEHSSALVAPLSGAKAIIYAAETSEIFVACDRGTGRELQIFIERKHGSLRDHCEKVWRSFREDAAQAGLKLSLADLTLVDANGQHEVLHGHCGVRPLLGRFELQFALGIAALTLIVLAVILAFDLAVGQTADLWGVAAPAIIAAIVALLLGAKEWRRQGVTWDR